MRAWRVIRHLSDSSKFDAMLVRESVGAARVSRVAELLADSLGSYMSDGRIAQSGSTLAQ